MSSFSVDRWVQTWRLARLSGDPLPWFRRLAAGYTEPHRFYHTVRHVEECLEVYFAFRGKAKNPAVLELALWFHDAIYNPRTTVNEERSAELAENCLGSHGAGVSLGERVRELIMATKHHPLTSDADTALMLDIDLSILGRCPDRFTEYTEQIRREYSWVPEPLYREKRTEILEGFLRRKRIYQTGEFAGRLEGQARANLLQAVQSLRGSAE